MVTVDEHTFDESLLVKGSKVLDCGCRGFNFTKVLSDLGCEVTCLDADPNVVLPKDIKAEHHTCIVSDKEGYQAFYLFGNGTASYAEEINDPPRTCTTYKVNSYKIKPFWDLIKLDIEGSEGEILRNMTEPLAKQISVEFHMHTCDWQTEDYIQIIFKHLSQWYDIHNAVKERRHGCNENYWDVLFILR